jgi:hypothetical protein
MQPDEICSGDYRLFVDWPVLLPRPCPGDGEEQLVALRRRAGRICRSFRDHRLPAEEVAYPLSPPVKWLRVLQMGRERFLKDIDRWPARGRMGPLVELI